MSVFQEYPSKMRMKPLQTVHPLHGELLMDKKPKTTDPFFNISCLCVPDDVIFPV